MRRFKKLYFPAMSVVAVVLLLFVLMGILTYRNLDREKKLAMQLLHLQGVALLDSLEAGARAAGMLPGWHEDAVALLIRQVAKNDDIAYIYLFDDKGIVVHSSNASWEKRRAPWRPAISGKKKILTRSEILPGGGHVYELAKLFSPLRRPYVIKRPRVAGGHGDLGIEHLHPNTTIVLGLKTTALEAAHRADIQHSLIMAAIVLALGSGAIFFIFVIQNYYLVERTLKQTRDYTRQVVASMANGLLSVDLQGRVVTYNRPALELLGLPESGARGLDLKKILDFEATGIAETLAQCRAVIEREIRHVLKTGATIPLTVSVTPIQYDSDRCNGAVIVLRDLREIKMLQAQIRRSEKLAAIGKLAASVAHEIRNPLSSIRGFAQFFSNSLKDQAEHQAYARTMVAEVDRINRVVTDLLTFARPMEARPAPTDITGLLEHLLRLVEQDAASRGVEIRTSIADVSRIALDGAQITQALLNLLLNAIQALPRGGRIEVGAALQAAAGRLNFWVADNGPGIPPEQVDKIFEPFFTTREKGTGLGLAIVQKIVQNHNGDIRVESPPPGKARGCRFTIGIPTGGGQWLPKERG